jgi:hypothetical protein
MSATEKTEKVVWVDPDNLVIIGKDTEHGPTEHALWDSRATRPANRGLIESIMHMGFDDTRRVKVKDLKEGMCVVHGRGTVIAARWLKQNSADHAAIKVPCRVTSMNLSDAAVADGFLNSALDELTPAQKAAKVAVYTNLGIDEKTQAKSLGVKVKSVQDYQKYNSVAQAVKSAVEKSKRIYYPIPDSDEEGYFDAAVPFGDVIAARLWKLSEEDQLVWVEDYYRRKKALKIAALKRAVDKLEDTEDVVFPPRYGTKTFKIAALQRFCTAFIGAAPFDSDGEVAEEARTHRAVIGKAVSDDFALGVMFAMGKAMALFDAADIEELEAKAPWAPKLTQEQMAALRELWKLSQIG